MAAVGPAGSISSLEGRPTGRVHRLTRQPPSAERNYSTSTAYRPGVTESPVLEAPV